ncbi:3-deoxy-manno-octulosonate cytidylyltransferase [Myxococcota bacterium]|nr:3-deoxy-manno-octulosonate cytidylyltransferase [Myxococcota bacterium]MCZ7620567.1 3-deoxy-manno-octulosonate cytidylyltransferase [Myxococcota bacterium]
MRAVGVIPARYAASRFPGKPLAKIAGRPLVQRVWDGVRTARRLERIVIATDDIRIADACRAFGAEVAMTAATHPTGTDRIAEVATGLDADIVVNVQGDEPLIEGPVIDAVVTALEGDPEAAMATLAHPAEPDGVDDPNRVKLVRDQRGRALYFSRSRIPYPRQPGARVLQHVGIYAYRREFLLEFVRLPQTELECSEQLEQLRALEHGHAIRVAVLEGWRSIPVDVPADIALVEAALREAGRC